MDTESFTLYIKTVDIYSDNEEYVETRFVLQVMNQNAIPLTGHYQKEKMRN